MHNWLPWRLILKYVARSRGFIDPVEVYAQLQKFSQPSEVAEPVELLRAGIVFHARGLLNSKVIQHNLDWVWPYWAQRQFDPSDSAFVPRAFSITHINLTNRNWSAIGLPGLDTLPVIDPRGLVTPCWDSWSVDCWLITDDGRQLLPSRAYDCDQRLLYGKSLAINSKVQQPGLKLSSTAEVVLEGGRPVCRVNACAEADKAGWLVFSARPYNPEGVSFINHIVLNAERNQWTINGKDKVLFSKPAERHHASDYHDADVHIHLLDKTDNLFTDCKVGMATAAAMYKVVPGQSTSVSVDIPIPVLDAGASKRARAHAAAVLPATSKNSQTSAWEASLAQQCKLDIPDEHFLFLYEAALRTLVLCTPGDVYAGPYTYKRFWYRDAVFIVHGLLTAGLVERAGVIIEDLPLGQQRNGYFLSQEGEWDSNGEVLWLIDRYCRISGKPLSQKLWQSVRAGADWIIKKRLPKSNAPWSGLLPAGFSAEHLGPNDYYYWDNYWAIAGLESASNLARNQGDTNLASQYAEEAKFLRGAVQTSIDKVQDKFHQNAVPASPTRRLDAGAIGSVVACYPLQLYSAEDERLAGTVEYLLDHCFHRGGFFQDMIHSGVNAYLTLHIAQALLRAGDKRYLTLMHTVAGLASPTGHWPEAVHPATGGGCMGDGHHAWAAVEWLVMLRHCFVREEGESLVLGSGIPVRWLTQRRPVSCDGAPTQYGILSMSITPLDPSGEQCRVSWIANWHRQAPVIEVALPDYIAVTAADGATEVVVQKQGCE